MGTKLTRSEGIAFVDLEGIIARGFETFVEVGAALAQIREKRLYRESYETFEDYCRGRWGMTDRRARQLMSASEVVHDVAETGTIVPVTESQARELKRVPNEHRAEVMRAASDDGAPTAEKIREAGRPYVPVSERVKRSRVKKVGETLGATDSDSPGGGESGALPAQGRPPKPKKAPSKTEQLRAMREQQAREREARAKQLVESDGGVEGTERPEAETPAADNPAPSGSTAVTEGGDANSVQRPPDVTEGESGDHRYASAPEVNEGEATPDSPDPDYALTFVRTVVAPKVDDFDTVAAGLEPGDIERVQRVGHFCRQLLAAYARRGLEVA